MYNHGDRVEHIATGQFGNVEVQNEDEVLINWDNNGWTPTGKIADWVSVTNIRKPELAQHIREQAEVVAAQATAIAEGRVNGPRYAAVQRLLNNVETLAAWVGDDR